MKSTLNAIWAVAFLCLPFNVLALEPGKAVSVTPLIKTTHSWDGQSIVYPAGQAEITGMSIEIAPGAQTGWHRHPVPSFALILQGTLEVKLKDGRVKRLQAGDALIEVVNTDHIGHNVGDIPVKLVLFYAGAVGQALTIQEP